MCRQSSTTRTASSSAIRNRPTSALPRACGPGGTWSSPPLGAPAARGGCPLGSLGGQLAERPEARALISAGFARWSSAIGDGLRVLQAAGHLPAGVTPDDLAVTLLAALQGGLLLAQVQRDTRPLETAVDTILALAATR